MKFPTPTKLSAALLAVSMLPLIQAGCSKQAAQQQAAATPAPAASAAPAAPATPPAPGPDASVTLTTDAWNAFNDKDYAKAIASAQKCIDLYQKQALDQQKAQTAPPSTDEQKKAQWALNDVGTCYYIVGQSNEKLGKKKEAVDAYKYLVANLGYALCWDPKGWFWPPAKVAQTSLKGLQLDALQ